MIMVENGDLKGQLDVLQDDYKDLEIRYNELE